MNGLLAIALSLGLVAGSLPGVARAAEPVQIMPLGDSITDGLQASHFCCGVPGAYRINLDAHLRAADYGFDFIGSRMSGPQPDKDHEGHPGYRIDEVHTGNDEGTDTGVNGWLAARAPDVVLLMIGTNDILQNHEIGTAPGRLGALIDRIMTLRPSAQIHVASIPPLVGPKSSLNPKVVTYNAGVRDVVAARAAGGRVHFVDAYAAVTAADLGTDGIHPTRSGHDKIANVWATAVLGSSPPPTDSTPPVITARTPAAGATDVAAGTTVSATFNEPLDPGTVNTGTFTLSSAGGAVAGTVEYNATSRVATFIPGAALAQGTTYTATLRGGSGGVEDVAGNALAANGTWQFSTATASAHPVSRLAGADRYATAAAVSAAGFPTPGVPFAFIATGTNFPDALAAGPAAATRGGPVLLVTPNAIPQATANELTRLRPARIVVLGGTGVVTDDVLGALRSYSANVTRVAGADRYATAAAISETYFASAAIAYIATGVNFPDALAGGAAAGHDGAPILLARQSSIPQPTALELTRLQPARIVVLGGSGVIDDGVLNALRAYSGNVSRISGPDRYATAAATSAAGYAAGSRPIVYLATGSVFPDGLAAAPVAARREAPLLLTAPSQLPPATATELKRLNAREVIVLGSTGAVSDAVIAQIRALWP